MAQLPNSAIPLDGLSGIDGVVALQPVGASIQQIGDINISGTLTSASQSGSAVKVGTLGGADANAENWIQQATASKEPLVIQFKASPTNNALTIENSSATQLFAINNLGLPIFGAGYPSGEVLLSSTASVNMNAANGTETTLYTVPTSRSAVITRVVVRNASTSLTTASWSLGFNAGTDTDFRADATSTGLTGATKAYIYYGIATAVVVGVAGTNGTFALKLNTQQGGAATVTIDVFGYLF